MSGFYVSNLKKRPGILVNSDLINDYLVYETFLAERHTSKKFVDDKLFSWGGTHQDFFIILEGVVLNKRDLCNGRSWLDTVYTLIQNNDISYFDLFRGNFAGGHYNLSNKEWLFYTSPTQDKPVFYYFNGDKYVVSSDLSYIAKGLKENGIAYSLNETAVYDMLSFGFMTDDYTYINEVKKLPYGSYISIKNDRFEIHRYYDFSYCEERDTGIGEEEIVNELDRLFRTAVDLEYNKDLEYGYRHIAALSGGLDSRMALWVASDLGFKDILNINFCQSDFLDEKIAKQVSQVLHTELLVKSLNDGSFLKDFREIIKMNSGLSLYSGISHANSILKYLNYDTFGIMHTGDVGDAIIGTFDHGNAGEFPGAYSVKLACKAGNVYNKQSNLEKYKMITRGFNGVIISMIGQDYYIENVSPFLYRDFFDYCISKIPHNLRDNHYIYKKWIISKYPDAAQIPVERYNNGRITDSKLSLSIRRLRKIGLKRIIEWILWKLGLMKVLNKRITSRDMNPFDKWYEDDQTIKTALDSFYSENIALIENNHFFSEELIEDIKQLYSIGTTIEKTQVITALGAVEYLFYKLNSNNEIEQA